MLGSVAFLLLAALSTPVDAGNAPNRVEVCSVALGTCSSLPAAALDPTLHPVAAAGQIAFIDPQTGLPVPPTAEQADELAQRLTVEEEQKTLTAPASVEKRADGTKVGRGDFRVYMRAELLPAPTKTANDASCTEHQP